VEGGIGHAQRDEDTSPVNASRLLALGLETVLLAVGVVSALAGAYLLLLALAAGVDRLRPARPRPRLRDASRVIVLIPAHDEALLIGAGVEALLAQSLDRARYEVVVVADNCSDDTAARAAQAGARVLVRTALDARGKGRALRFAMDALLAEQPAPDVIVVVDADTIADPAFLAALLEAYECGSDAAQGVSLLVPDASSRSQLRAAAFLLINRVRPAGRARLGLACHLQGNGMLFARSVLEQHPWDAFTSAEDLEYSVGLRRAGVRVDFAPRAIVRSPTAPTARAADLQSQRWEGGKVHVARTMVPALVRDGLRRGRLASLELAFGILIPPLGLLAGLAATGALVSAVLAAFGAISWWPLVPFAVALTSIVCFALVGLWAGRAPASAYRALAGGPGLALRKLLRVRRLFAHGAESWVRTDRADDEAK
jgi:cellulose synthase/poly-beta-1,6-N-acetylglucosamine synthase-like glycosyltransferase